MGSFAWKSILKARKVVLLGAIWRVGDGESIRIYKDRWLPRSSVTLIPSVLDSEARVAELIDSETGGWNDHMLHSCFIPFEAQQIRSIPLCVSPQANFLYWAFEMEGVYTVKSGYKAICEEENLAEASVSNSAATRDLWSGIWKLKCPGKIEHFLWRACTNCLPTKANLLKRKIVTDSICHRCGRCEETTMHALWSCEAIKLFWCNDFSWVNQFEAAQGDFLDLVGRLMSRP